jgi:hypothetical protein
MLERLEIDAPLSFIGGWFMENRQVCDDLVALFRATPAAERVRGASVDRYGNRTYDDDVKVSAEINFPPESPVAQFQAYLVELQKCVRAYIELYPWCNKFAPWTIIQRVNLQSYPPGGGYKIFHTERVSATPPVSTRHLVFMTYLNDVEDGGGTEFLHQKFTAPARRGLTLIWPADWTHTHRGIVSPTQEKLIVTGWFNFVDEPPPLLDQANLQ